MTAQGCAALAAGIVLFVATCGSARHRLALVGALLALAYMVAWALPAVSGQTVDESYVVLHTPTP